MISAGVSKFGKTPIYFVKPGIKVNQEYYRSHVLRHMIPQMHKLSKNSHFIFQQDGARSHTAKETIKYLKEKVPEIIEPDEWPPSSPDLNPLDYTIWSVVEQMVYRERIRDVDHLKKRILEAWKRLNQDTINKSIDLFRPRLKKMIEVQGKRFEHLL